MADEYRFSFGPWNIHEGRRSVRPAVRPTIEFATNSESTSGWASMPCSSTTTTPCRTWTRNPAAELEREARP